MARILVIDDNVKFLEMMRTILENERYEVVTASNGKDGIDIYSREPVDLVITDLIMPEKDGAATIFELTKKFPDVKIIMISGGGNEGSAQDYLYATNIICNVKYMFSKPFAMDEMLQAIKEILNQ